MNFTTLSGGSGLTHFEGGCGGGNSFSEISILVSVTKNNLVSMLFKLFLLRRGQRTFALGSNPCLIQKPD
jgi:hypothetical protein